MTVTSGWQRRFILLFKSEKTLNAGEVVKTFNQKSINEMKATIITTSMCDSTVLSHKPRTKDLESHLGNLKHQFIGKPELNFYHAALIVLLRRHYKPKQIFTEFERLWENEASYLLTQLDLRWIVSACDDFIDYSSNAPRAAILMNVITLINTLKVYETKQFLQLSTPLKQTPLLTDKIDVLHRTHQPLYDGLTYFRIGTDDTLINMRRRYKQFYHSDKLAATMLLFVFDKLQTNDSAFSTLRSLHKDDKSKWWLDSL